MLFSNCSVCLVYLSKHRLTLFSVDDHFIGCKHAILALNKELLKKNCNSIIFIQTIVRSDNT